MTSLGERIKSVAEADTNNFVELVRLSGLDPSTDFRHMDLSGLDFSDCDLSGFDFRGCRLKGANFHNANIDGAVFDAQWQHPVGHANVPSQNTLEENFVQACAGGQIDLVRSMINNGIGLNARHKDQTPLCYACEAGQLDIVRLLIASGADVDEESFEDASEYGNPGMTPFYMAGLHGFADIMTLLLDHGASIDSPYGDAGFTALQAACKKGDISTAALLIDRGASIDLGNGNGNTPLIYACEGGHKDMVKFLLDRGASAVYPAGRSRSALMAACGKESSDIVELLISAGANVNLEDYHRDTPLKCASQAGNVNIIKILLDNNADPNFPPTYRIGSPNDYFFRLKSSFEFDEEKNALMIASEKNHFGIVKMLLDHGADPNILTVQTGKTALDYALSAGSMDAVQLLCKFGGRRGAETSNC